MLKRNLMLSISLGAYAALQVPAYAQIFGVSDKGAPYCSADYDGTITVGGDSNEYGWQDTDDNGARNSCIIRPEDFHQFGYAGNGMPFCSPEYSGPETIGGDANAYGWEDTNFNGFPNSCFVEFPTSSNEHAYGLADNGSPYCSPDYDKNITPGGDADYGWEDTDNDNKKNSCVISGSSGSSELAIAKVTSPSRTHKRFPASNAIDGDTSYASRWSSKGSSAILLFDLGASENVTDIDIAFGRGDTRSYTFEVLASDSPDGGFTSLFEGESSGTSSDYENFDLTDISARYIQLEVNSNSARKRWTSVTDVKVNGAQDVPSTVPDSTSLTHFGQPITLNGANVAWHNYGADIGSETSTAQTLRSSFSAIREAGGNSARWWLHASGWFTPNIGDDGYVTGISTLTDEGISDEQVIDQVREILDVAWEEGIVLNISLFSFEMACSANNTENGSVHRGEQFNEMLNTYPDSYIDNVLAPLVSGLKDHPALFAWEVFNEADGMTQDSDFFADNCPNGSFPQQLSTLQSFVNKSAAKIHALDKNVKVTTSVSQPAWLNQYTNEALTSIDNADPSGVLDFYQAHYYWVFDHGSSPYSVSASDRGLDRPIVLGEFGYGEVPITNTANDQLANALLDNGYAGSWVWDQNGLTADQINTVISGAAAYSPLIDKEAVEACISSQSSSCYKD